MDNITVAIGDILFASGTGEYLLLVNRRQVARSIGYSEVSDWVWDMHDLNSGSIFWEWEFVICESGHYTVIA